MLDNLGFTVVKIATNFKVVVYSYSSLVGGHFELGKLGIHYGKIAISKFKQPKLGGLYNLDSMLCKNHLLCSIITFDLFVLTEPKFCRI